MVGQLTGVMQSPSHYSLEDVLVIEAGDDRATHRSADASHHHAREQIGSLDAVGEVVGVEGDDAAHSVP
jgi:hypothetical protein